MYQKIILINGKKRSGKDFFARAVQNELLSLNKTVEILSFADPVKAIVAKTLNISLSDLDRYKNDPSSYNINIIRSSSHYSDSIIGEMDFRQILQRFGTEAMKEWFGDDVWAQMLMQRVSKSNAKFILVPDFRFLCENIGDVTVRVKNDDVVSNDTHKSENELNYFKFDYVIDNTGHRDISDDVKNFVSKIL